MQQGGPLQLWSQTKHFLLGCWDGKDVNGDLTRFGVFFAKEFRDVMDVMDDIGCKQYDFCGG